MSNNYKSTLQSNNTELSSNNLSLQELLTAVNNLPEAGGSNGGTNTSDATATADEIFAGETAYIASGKVTGTFTIDNELSAQNTLIPQIRDALLCRKVLAPITTLPSIGKNEVCFRDYDGTLLYSCSVEDVMSLKELPALPVHEGLICQGWNYDLDTIKSYNRAVDVGATYITDDGKTRLYINIVTEGRMNMPLRFSQTVANGVTIDWGDGSATHTISGTGNVITTHTYSSIGNYVITLDAADGCSLGLGHVENNSNYSILDWLDTTEHKNKVYCSMLQKVEIGNNITRLGADSFNSCYSLSSITIPNSVASIDSNVFNSCYSLSSITIPSSVTSIGAYTFRDCCNLSSIAIPNSVTSIGYATFILCSNLSSIAIPNSVTSIAPHIFDSCYSLSSIAIPSSVTSIGEHAFYLCRNLSSIAIPNSVTSIGGNIFYLCYSLSSIAIPSSVTSIGSNVFNCCYSLAICDFTSHTSVPTLESIDALSDIPPDCVIKVPAALYNKWITTKNWSTYLSQIVAV